jgi:hypothetical protein
MTFWVPFSPNQRQVTVGNQVYSVSPMDVQQIQGGGVAPLGPKRVGSTSTHEVIGVDANGNPIKQTLTTTSTPSSPGASNVAPSPKGIPLLRNPSRPVSRLRPVRPRSRPARSLPT